MDGFIALFILWVILGNLWHLVLLASRSGIGRPSTISEHAVEFPYLLVIHRIVHTLPVLLFLPLIIWYLIPGGYDMAAALLAIGALTDSLQTLTLNSNTARLYQGINWHNLFAWVMTASYLMYSLLISRIADISVWLYGPLLIACIVLLVFGITNTFKRFFIHMQMSYFIILSVVGIIAHIKLVLQ